MGRVILDEVDSTNAEALRRAPRTQEPCWILARRQTAGRGRRGRAWADPEGNFAASLVAATELPPQHLALHGFAAALALHDALGALTGRPHSFSLKWPNDVLAAGSKVAGILLESLTPVDGASAPVLVIGVGVNLANVPELPDGAGPPPGSVVDVTGARIDPPELLDRLAPALARWQATLTRDGFAPLREAWLARAARLGQPIVARTPRETIEGVFETLDSSGALVVSTGAGRRVIPAADVHFGEETPHAPGD